MELSIRIVMTFGSAFVCLIPARYRGWWPVRDEADLVTPAVLSGLLELVIGVPGAVIWVAITLKTGLTLMFNEFLLFPFIMIEGIVRTLAAVSSGEVYPTFSLQIVAWIHGGLEGAQEQRRMGPLVPDIIEHGRGRPWDLRVLSCRPKRHWNAYVTIRYEGEFYQVSGEEIPEPPRRFGYLLKKNPETRLVVVVYDYSPEDVLSETDAIPSRWQPNS